jgi:hypothetical protein
VPAAKEIRFISARKGHSRERDQITISSSTLGRSIHSGAVANQAIVASNIANLLFGSDKCPVRNNTGANAVATSATHEMT